MFYFRKNISNINDVIHSSKRPLNISWWVISTYGFTEGFRRFKKKSLKSVASNIFWYVKTNIYWKFIQHAIHWDKTLMLKKLPLDKVNVTKNALFFFNELQLITVLLSIHNFYRRWGTRFISLKLCVGFSIFDSVSFFLKFIFLFN